MRQNREMAGPADRSRTTNTAWILAATILGSSMVFIDGTVVNVALPAIQTSLHATLRDVQWVTEVAVAHESVVEFFARQAGATVIPMKLFTMFSSEKRAVSETRARLRDIEDVVSRIAGCEEWGVRITYQPSAPSRPGRQAKSASGTAFLEAKKAARDAAQRSIGTATEEAEAAYTTLAAMAREAKRRQDTPAGATAPPLIDAAFLVPAAGRSRFRAAVKKLAAASTDGTHITLTGPWPSYNFVQPESAS